MKVLAAIIVMMASLNGIVASAGGLETVLVAPSGSPPAGQEVVFFVYFHNWSSESIRTALPESIECRLEVADQVITVAARSVKPAETKPVVIHGKGFARARYIFKIPESIQGTVRMRVPTFDNAGVMFTVSARADVDREAPVAAVDEADAMEPKYKTLDSLFALYQPYLGNITAYESTYFLVGADPEESKFQVSFKYRLFNPGGTIAERYEWMKGFHFAYTQTSFWDLQSASAPFEDTSYKPELFFLSSNIGANAMGIKRFFLQTGFQHESNGRAGEFSRSTNRLYVNPIFVFFNEKNQYGFQISPRIWTYMANDEDTNPNLEDYRGYFDVGLKFGKADGFVVGSKFGWAKEGASVQVDVTYPLHRFLFNNLDLYLQAQYYNGLAESLLNYSERSESFRFGLAIIR